LSALNTTDVSIQKLLEELAEAQRELKILDGERPFSPFLRPHFSSGAQTSGLPAARSF
jgi:hypothetical protein